MAKVSSLSNMVLTLLVITFAVGGILGFVYQQTKEPIALSALLKQTEAIEKVMPGFDNKPMEEMYEIEAYGGLMLKVFPAKKDGQLLGVAVETSTSKGYGGEIRLIVGMKPDGSIVNYEVLEQKETPGLGTKMVDWFKPAAAGTDKSRSAFFDKLFGVKAQEGAGNGKSIIGKNPGTTDFRVSKDGGEIDAITAATITSRAFLDAVQTAYKAYVAHAQGTEVDANTGATAKTGNEDTDKAEVRVDALSADEAVTDNKDGKN